MEAGVVFWKKKSLRLFFNLRVLRTGSMAPSVEAAAVFPLLSCWCLVVARSDTDDEAIVATLEDVEAEADISCRDPVTVANAAAVEEMVCIDAAANKVADKLCNSSGEADEYSSKQHPASFRSCTSIIILEQ